MRIGRPNSSNMEISDFELKDIAKEQIKILDRIKTLYQII